MKANGFILDVARFAAECTCGTKFTIIAPPVVVAGVKQIWEARHSGAGHAPVAAAISRKTDGRSP